MTDTVFTNGVTLTDADWFNDLNRLHYTILGDPANAAAIATALVVSGTWTPVLTFATPGDLSVTYSSQIGLYRSFGSIAILDFRINTSAFTHTTASGACKITGIPFTAVSSSQATRGSLAWQGITKATYTHCFPTINSAGTFITIDASGSGQNTTSVVAADMPTGGTIALHGSIIYFK